MAKIPKVRITFCRNTQEENGELHRISAIQEKVWGTGINGFTGHLGSKEGDTFSDLYACHLSYAQDFHADPPSIPEVLRALADLVESELYLAKVKDETPPPVHDLERTRRRTTQEIVRVFSADTENKQESTMPEATTYLTIECPHCGGKSAIPHASELSDITYCVAGCSGCGRHLICVPPGKLVEFDDKKHKHFPVRELPKGVVTL